MTARERQLTMRLMQKIDRNPEYAKSVGLSHKETFMGQEIKKSEKEEES